MNKIFSQIKKSIKNFIINHRIFSLIMSAILGVALSAWAYCYLPCLLPETEYRLKTSLIMLLLALPTVFLIWFFRTYDVREQIEKSRTNNQLNNFANALKLFVEKENIEANCIGLKLLLEIKHQELYEKQINLATKFKNLQNANLSGADLHGADLRNAELQGAILVGADLRWADLRGVITGQVIVGRATSLINAKLQEAKLQGADLQRAELQGAKLQKAEYNDKTIFPHYFNPKAHGMIKK